MRALVEAGLTVLRQRGAAGLTVADVLAEAGLSTRAFYRHFHSKDELVLAVYEHEAQRRYAGPRGAAREGRARRAPRSRRGSTRCSRSVSSRGAPAAPRCSRPKGARVASRLPRGVRGDPRRRGRSRSSALLARAPEPGSGARRVVGLRGHLGARRAEAARRADRPGRRRAPTCCASVCPALGRSGLREPAAGRQRRTSTPSTRRCRARSCSSAAGGAAARDAPVRVRARAADPRDVGRRRRAPARHHAASTTSATRAPFVDKDAVRRFRDERNDPYGGLCALPPDELTAVMSTSGTTGDPTLVPEKWGGGGGRPSIITRDFWGMGVRPGDHVALVLFTFRGPTYGLFQGLGTIPILFDFDPAEMERFCELSLRYRPDRSLQLRFGAHQRGARGVRAARLRPARRLRVVQGRRVRGRAAEPARARARRGVGRRAVRAHRHRRRHRRVRMSRARRAARLGGHRAGRGPRPRRHRRRSPTASGASSSPRRCSIAPRRSSATAPTTSCASPTSRACAVARTRACGRSAARATRSSSTGGRCCRSTCGPRSSRSTRARWACSR